MQRHSQPAEEHQQGLQCCSGRLQKLLQCSLSRSPSFTFSLDPSFGLFFFHSLVQHICNFGAFSCFLTHLSFSLFPPCLSTPYLSSFPPHASLSATPCGVCRAFVLHTSPSPAVLMLEYSGALTCHNNGHLCISLICHACQSPTSCSS